MLKLALISITLALAGCVTQTHQAVDPSGVRIERALGAGYGETYTLTGAGWSCSGKIIASQYEQVISRTVPLACTDGATGVAVVEYASANRAMQVNTAVTVTYRLSNGKSGVSRV